MATVFSVIFSSIPLGSRVKLTGSMSPNTGVQPQRVMAWVVEAKVKGVVMTSPFKSKASIRFSRARWPFVCRAR